VKAVPLTITVEPGKAEVGEMLVTEGTAFGENKNRHIPKHSAGRSLSVTVTLTRTSTFDILKLVWPMKQNKEENDTF